MIAGSFFKKIFPTGMLQDAYSELTSGMKMGWNAFQTPFKYAGAGLNWLDHKMASASSIPLLQSAINLIKDEPLFAGVVEGVNSINTTLDDVGKFGENIDELIRRGFGFGQHHSNSPHSSPNHPQHRVGDVRTPPGVQPPPQRPPGREPTLMLRS